ncbi:Glycosyl transferase family 2 [Butyrivibrio fibrisolvens]|uniref:Glycosyl transferase family 2 n=1 Tax=Butyrivibrio fibrisolvens TaxID=831 RepID=A0A1H9TVD4_BUTFI|nr:glycosyltransferase family 2 protein [Butyrivibrio fibrisolvens]SES00703.1 Glycosyl transferase family 2 [Butyrivibrio fibrisolvens]
MRITDEKVSVIVPAYNAHDTLARCLGSLVNQTLQDIEIIVVNDASTDDTWEIMSRCEKQFPDKVIIINSDRNRGAGGARNMALDMASGEYIGLVDSDDYVAPNMYELLYSKAKDGDYDIVDSGFYQEATDTARLYTGDELTGILNDEKRKRLIAGGGYLVTKVFKRELWQKPVIRMRENVKCLADMDILIYMFLRASSIDNVKEILYKYCDLSDSATKTMDVDAYFDSVYGAMQAIYDSCHRMSTYAGAIAAVEYAILSIYSFGINRCIYDQIHKYGASTEKIKIYFDEVGIKEETLLHKLTLLKNKIVSNGYDMNPFVVAKIKELDIEIMKECDKRFGRG